MLQINNLTIPIGGDETLLRQKAAKILGVRPAEFLSFSLQRQSIDARKKDDVHLVCAVRATLNKESAILRRAPKGVTAVFDTPYALPALCRASSLPPVVAGMGPAGLFAALTLSRAGLRPIVLERGQDVDRRTVDVECFWSAGLLSPASNVQFGEGGAGTFSDGKLNTLVKDPKGRNRKVLELFVEAGAPEEILYESRPHLGTDLLVGIVSRMREEILRLGGEVRFGCRMTDVRVEQGAVRGVTLQTVGGEPQFLETGLLVLAVGHSARDTFVMLEKRQVPMQAKSFAVGVRIEHPQRMIDRNQYGTDYPDLLPAASYKVTRRTESGRGVYSFCMCPGGYVVNASSEEGALAVNGMSYQARDGRNANSAMIVTVTPEDYGGMDVLAGVEFQRKLERAAYRLGGGQIPVQLFRDFCRNTPSSVLGEIEPSVRGKYRLSNVREIFPQGLSSALEEGIRGCDVLIPGFAREDAVLSGVESRTSSPVRILRDEQFESRVCGLYPCGEGAGYAGGITSAAMDGLKIAEAIAKKYMPWYDNS